MNIDDIVNEAVRSGWTTLIAGCSLRNIYDKRIDECHMNGTLKAAFAWAAKTAIATYEREQQAAINPTWPTPPLRIES